MEEEEDEDEERTVLIPSDTYDGLICGQCVRSHELLRDRAGKQGWMRIEPDEGVDGWRVIGRRDVINGLKREPPDDGNESGKRPRLEPGMDEGKEQDKPKSDSKEEPPRITRKGQGDVFLAHGIREQLKHTLDVGHLFDEGYLWFPGQNYRESAIPSGGRRDL